MFAFIRYCYTTNFMTFFLPVLGILHLRIVILD